MKFEILVFLSLIMNCIAHQGCLCFHGENNSGNTRQLRFKAVHGIANSINKLPAFSYEGMVKPANGIIVQSYYQGSGNNEGHPAIDIAGRKGTPLASMGEGYVSRIFRNARYGNALNIKLDNGLELLYAHLENYQTGHGKLKKGQRVSAGERVGTMGTTGWSMGIHLHLEVRKNGRTIDPEPIMRQIPDSPLSLDNK